MNQNCLKVYNIKEEGEVNNAEMKSVKKLTQKSVYLKSAQFNILHNSLEKTIH